jgi:tRNA(Ile)-lysidine synthase
LKSGVEGSIVGCDKQMNRIQIDLKLLRQFPPGDRYLVGVSGGRDSVALLHSLLDLGYRKLIVCHFDHQLRGRASDADTRFVQKLVERYNQRFVGQALLPRWSRAKAGRLPNSRMGYSESFRSGPTAAKAYLDLELGSANVRMLAKKRKMSVETAAREARYSFFARIAKRRRCHTVFLAHHADDLVETFLINLFRGASSAGLAGIRELSARRVGDIELTIVRPFLHVWRKEIDHYMRKHGLKFREDASNKNLNPLRNRIRHRVIPFLEKILGRNIRPTIWRAAAIAAEEENWIEKQLPDSAAADLSVAQLRALPIALQRRAILKWLRTQKIPEIGFDLIERVRSLADSEASIAKVNLPKDRHARRRTGRIFVE